MLRWLLNRRTMAALATLVVAVVLMTLTARERQRVTVVENWLLDALAPVTRAAHQVAAVVDGARQQIAELARLREENQRLRQELERYRQQQAVMERGYRSYSRIRALLALKEREPGAVAAANVIGRDPDRWLEEVLLDVGTADGVAVDMVVIEPRGVVGRITRTTRFTATVLLLTDPQSGVGVLVSRSGDAGVAVGDPARSGTLEVRFFNRDADVKVGDRVVTSGYGGLFPPNLDVGEVIELRYDETGLVLEAVVQPFVDFDRLFEVLVVQPVQRSWELR
ncbi:MAG: rod shape-determining protein MreC [Bacillota bacterium]|nr:MAG: rod shape-determining protein MreC [Bacillota bacterium]